MKKQYRLLKTYQFQEVITKGKKISNSEFLIYCLNQIMFTENIRIGIAVPKKIVLKAFMRNKIKRQIKEMLIDVPKDAKIDIVIIIRRKFLENTYQENHASLKKVLTKLDL